MIFRFQCRIDPAARVRFRTTLLGRRVTRDLNGNTFVNGRFAAPDRPSALHHLRGYMAENFILEASYHITPLSTPKVDTAPEWL